MLDLRDVRKQAKGTARRTAAACDVGVPRRMDRSSQSVAAGLYECRSRTASEGEAPAASRPGRWGIPGMEARRPDVAAGPSFTGSKPSALWAALAVELVLRERAVVCDTERP
jgi:hypothetical protein